MDIRLFQVYGILLNMSATNLITNHLSKLLPKKNVQLKRNKTATVIYVLKQLSYHDEKTETC